MQLTTKTAILALALTVVAAPIENEKRQLGGSTGSIPSLTLGTGSALPTGLGSLGSSGLGSLGSGSGSTGLGSLSGLSGSSGLTSSSGLGSSSGTGLDSSGSGLTGLSGSSSSITPTTTLKERQDLSSFGSGTSGLGSLTSGLSGSSGSSSLGSLGGLSGTSGSSSLSGLGSSTGTTTSGSTTRSDSSTAASGGCKAISLLFARGTGEMGTMGSVIGPPLATALANAAGSGKVSSEGVDYPADASGNANLGATGGAAMAKQAKAILSSCPSTKLVLSGYSQGAMAVHNALSSQGLDGSKVAAVVAFGDPFNGQDFKGVASGKTKEFCGSSDGLCSSGGTTGQSGGHLSYGDDADAAAKFIVSAAGA